MLGLFKDVVPYVTPKPKVDVPRADNIVFALHYRVTFAILIVSTILVSSYTYIDSSGSAIQCMINKGSSIPDKIINRYCWIMSTFTLPKHYEGEPGKDMIYYGVGPHTDEDEKVFHQYYQWVPLVLSLQAIAFYAPHWIWKALDNSKMKNIVVGLNKHLDDTVARDKKITQLAEYLKKRMRYRREHQSWARNFFLCECLNFINVVAQIFITDWFLGYEFTTYGTEVLAFSRMEPENRVDPMSRVFPRMTKCTFHKYGGSGTIQVLDALCVLGMNILNEKIYIFLWFWFIILAVITGCNLIFRALQLFVPSVRDRLVKLENTGYIDKGVHRADVDAVIKKLTYSDWLILYYLAQAMNKENFGVLMTKLANELPEYPYATDEEAAAMRKLQQDRDFNDEDDEMVKKPLSLDDPTDNPEKESSNSRTGTIPSLAKLGGSLFKK